MGNWNQEAADILSAEKLQLGSIRSLLDDDRFQRYVRGLRQRYEQTDQMIDFIDADDSLKMAALKAARETYQNELRIIDNCGDRIKEIDETIAGMKQNNQRDGNEGRAGSAPPREKE